MYCFDTDALSAFGWPRPPPALLRRAATLELAEQSTTAITIGEIAYGLAKRNDSHIADRMHDVIASVWTIHPFDDEAAERYGPLRAQLESEGRRLAEPDLRIASIVLARDLTLITGNAKHFSRIPELRVEDWLR
jgi:predicted nucleic acid-binding protein